MQSVYRQKNRRFSVCLCVLEHSRKDFANVYYPLSDENVEARDVCTRMMARPVSHGSKCGGRHGK